jgi:hypothetical protein
VRGRALTITRDQRRSVYYRALKGPTGICRAIRPALNERPRGLSTVALPFFRRVWASCLARRGGENGGGRGRSPACPGARGVERSERLSFASRKAAERRKQRFGDSGRRAEERELRGVLRFGYPDFTSNGSLP